LFPPEFVQAKIEEPKQLLRLLQSEPSFSRQAVRRAVFEGFRHGRRAAWLYAADWENPLTDPVEAIRTRHSIIPPVYYPKVLATIRAEQAANAQPTPVAA
jgi:ubiquinone biosynthesis protein COQ4